MRILMNFRPLSDLVEFSTIVRGVRTRSTFFLTYSEYFTRITCIILTLVTFLYPPLTIIIPLECYVKNLTLAFALEHRYSFDDHVWSLELSLLRRTGMRRSKS